MLLKKKCCCQRRAEAMALEMRRRIYGAVWRLLADEDAATATVMLFILHTPRLLSPQHANIRHARVTHEEEDMLRRHDIYEAICGNICCADSHKDSFTAPPRLYAMHAAIRAACYIILLLSPADMRKKATSRDAP